MGQRPARGPEFQLGGAPTRSDAYYDGQVADPTDIGFAILPPSPPLVLIDVISRRENTVTACVVVLQGLTAVIHNSLVNGANLTIESDLFVSMILKKALPAPSIKLQARIYMNA